MWDEEEDEKPPRGERRDGKERAGAGIVTHSPVKKGTREDPILTVTPQGSPKVPATVF